MTRAAVAAILLLVLTPAPCLAVFLELTAEEQANAIRIGEGSVTADTFGAEWRVANGTGESVTVVTPFHRLALAARHAAFQNEPLKSQDQARMLKELRDRLMLWVNVYGAREDFARHLAPRLVVGDREIEPAMVQNERTAMRQDNGQYLARNVYWFPTRELTPTARPTLVLRDPEGQVVAQFAIDLGRMR